MEDIQQALLVGGTGRTGRLVLEQLLRRGIRVRAIVRSPHKLPAAAADNPNLSVTEADLQSMSDEELGNQVHDCQAIVSCLGHVTSFKGIFGPPRDLVAQATRRLCRSIEVRQPSAPVKFILLSSVSVNHPGGLDTRRRGFEKAVVRMLRVLVPPSKDNQQAADFLFQSIGAAHPFVQWVAVRPDTLVEGGVSDYTLQENLVSSLFRPDQTSMSNVAHFMGELTADPKIWDAWKGRLPVIINAGDGRG
jgi:nucleoside-diphosphate-sugar epimerase